MPTANSPTLSALLSAHPQPRSQPKKFGQWLDLLLKERRFTPQVLAEEARLSVSDLFQMTKDPSSSTKGMRRDVYEAALYLLERQRPTGTTPTVVEKRSVSIYFTGRDGEHTGKCLRNLQDAIRSAQTTVRVMAYVLSATYLLDEMEVAARRGVKVSIIHDSKAFRPSSRHQGISFIADRTNDKAHNKILIIDDEMVFTGSFNFTYAADHCNAENLLEIRDPWVVDQYVAYWQNTHRGIQMRGGYAVRTTTPRRVRNSLPTDKKSARRSRSGR